MTKQKEKPLQEHKPYTKGLLSTMMDIWQYILSVAIVVLATRNKYLVFASTKNYNMAPCPVIYPHFVG